MQPTSTSGKHKLLLIRSFFHTPSVTFFKHQALMYVPLLYPPPPHPTEAFYPVTDKVGMFSKHVLPRRLAILYNMEINVVCVY